MTTDSRHFLRSVLEFSGAIVTATNAVEALSCNLSEDEGVCHLGQPRRHARRVKTHLRARLVGQIRETFEFARAAMSGPIPTDFPRAANPMTREECLIGESLGRVCHG